MRILLFLLLVIAAISVVDARSTKEGIFIGESSFEFRTNSTFPFSAGIEELLQNAKNHLLYVTMLQNCDHPITFKFGKCDEAYYRQEVLQRNTTLVFDYQGIEFLLDAVRKACDGGWNHDGSLHFRVYSQEMTICKFIFRLTEKNERTSDFNLIETTIPYFYYYEKTVQKTSENSIGLLHICALAALCAIFGFSLFMNGCLSSDGLGDEDEDDKLEMQSSKKIVPKFEGPEEDIQKDC